jgi:hypothetical protein
MLGRSHVRWMAGRAVRMLQARRDLDVPLERSVSAAAAVPFQAPLSRPCCRAFVGSEVDRGHASGPELALDAIAPREGGREAIGNGHVVETRAVESRSRTSRLQSTIVHLRYACTVPSVPPLQRPVRPHRRDGLGRGM